MISTSGILSTGEKKWMPMKSSGRFTPVGETGDRQRRGVGAEQRVGFDDVLDLLEHLVLELGALEDGLDDEVDALEIGRVGGRGDAAEQCVGLLLGGLATRECLGLDLLRVGLALARRPRW